MSKMRLDKFLSNAKVLSRKEAEIAIKKHQIKINEIIATKKDILVDTSTDIIKLNEQVVKLNKFIYLMINKPEGYVSSTDDPRDKTVLDLLPIEYRKYNLFPCGRLDKDTLGLIILTNNGKASHALLSPKHHVEKKYYFKLIQPIEEKDVNKIEQGITLKDGYTTKPCKINMINSTEGYIILTEGKYHEIKRMFSSVSNKITFLKRISFSNILLDPNLKEGEFRSLNDNEIKVFEQFSN